MATPHRTIIEISWMSLFRIIALLAALVLIVALREVLLMLVAVFIAVAAINPTIVSWQRYMNRTLAVTLFYILFAGVVAVITLQIVPTFFSQLQQLAANSDQVAENIQRYVGTGSVGQTVASSVQRQLASFSPTILQTTVGALGRIATVVAGIVISFYLLLEEKNAKDFFAQILPRNRYKPVYEITNKISERLGRWLRGQVTLMLIIGAIDYVVYLIFRLPTPLPLAAWAGLTELIPLIGPIIGVIPAVLITISQHGLVAGIILALVVGGGVQLLENHFLVPRIMGRAVGVSPVLVLISVLVGGTLFGMGGALLAIPIAAVISVIIDEWELFEQLFNGQHETQD
jgi:predicted PurR-regulated permease PerM